jgi:hypothetical protein
MQGGTSLLCADCDHLFRLGSESRLVALQKVAIPAIREKTPIFTLSQRV